MGVTHNVYSRLKGGDIRRFEQGEIMPTLNVQSRETRFLLPDKITVSEMSIEWRLLGEA